MKKLFAILALFAVSAHAATLLPVPLLNPVGSTAGQAVVSNGPTTQPAWQSGGAISVTATRGSTAATLAARFAHTVNVVDDFGAACNGTTDDSAKFTAAGASLSSTGGVIDLPFGSCLAPSFVLPTGVSLIGLGPGASTILTNSPTENMITVSGGNGGLSEIAYLQLASTVTRTGGAYVTSATSVLVEDVAAQGYFVGFNFVGASPTALNVNSTLDNVTMFSPAVGAGSAAAVFENYSNAVVHHLVASGATTGQEPDEGLVFKNGDTAFVSDTNVTHHGYALAIVPVTNENNFSFNAANDDFDSAGLISGGVDADSCFIAPTGNGNVYESHFSNVWCGLSLGSGALVGSLGTGVIQGMHWSDGIFDGNAINGFQIGANVSSWSVTGGVAAGNGGSGYFVGSASTDWSMIGVRGGPIGDRGSNGSFGVGVSANASNNYTIIADTSGNTGGGLADLGTGTSKLISSNGSLSAGGNDALLYQNTSAQSIPASTATTITGWTKVSDRVNANFNASTGVFTAPATGIYQVSGQENFAAAAWGLGEIEELCAVANSVTVACGSNAVQAAGTFNVFVTLPVTDISLAAGQTIVLQALQLSGAARSLGASGTQTFISISRQP